MGWYVWLKRFDKRLCIKVHFKLSTVMEITWQYFLS